MKVLIVGAHGQIGQRLVQQMADSSHQSRAMVRSADQQDRMDGLRADETVVADLEGDCSAALAGCDAVIFTAGSGGHTPPQKTEDVDRNGAINLIDQAVANGVRRFIIVSSINADTPEKGSDAMQHYFAAKKAADDHLRASGLDYTIVRPGRLLNDDGTGRVDIAKELGRYGEVTRDDVAAVLLATLDAPNTVGRHFELLAGDTPIEQAVRGV
ncbi:SDR family oxidoreductase [Salinisphaera aquimarina]|uniref:SDR family oxidoreductase n=1 Tax=Salinisphaera aquimarina TaxID=2094031 RepID=A0ABV7EQS2_9GAMM